MSTTRCPVPGCAFEVEWDLPAEPTVSPYVTDGPKALREAVLAAATPEAERVESVLLDHGANAHDPAVFIEAVIAAQTGP